MKSITGILALVFYLVTKNLDRESENKAVAVKWLNRLYYDLVKNQEKFISILEIYSDFNENYTDEEIILYNSKLIEFNQGFDRRGMRDMANETCARIEFLVARFKEDFYWLKIKNNSEYHHLENLILGAKSIPVGYLSMAQQVQLEINEITSRVTSMEGLPLTKKRGDLIHSLKKELESYIMKSNEDILRVKSICKEAQITLLTVSEYEDSLYTEGTNNPNLIVLGEVNMSRNTYKVGQAAAVGENAQANNITFNQMWYQAEENINLAVLSQQLKLLHDEMKTEVSEPNHELALGAVSAAQKSAEKGDGSKTLEYLSLAGKWTLSVSEKIGVGLATAAIKTALGL